MLTLIFMPFLYLQSDINIFSVEGDFFSPRLVIKRESFLGKPQHFFMHSHTSAIRSDSILFMAHSQHSKMFTTSNLTKVIFNYSFLPIAVTQPIVAPPSLVNFWDFISISLFSSWLIKYFICVHVHDYHKPRISKSSLKNISSFVHFMNFY